MSHDTHLARARVEGELAQALAARDLALEAAMDAERAVEMARSELYRIENRDGREALVRGRARLDLAEEALVRGRARLNHAEEVVVAYRNAIDLSVKADRLIGQRESVVVARPTASMDEKHEWEAWLTKRSRRPTVAFVRASSWMKTAEVFVSRRVAREELGDVLENLRRFEREGRPRWHLYVHAVIGIVLAVWHTWGDKMSALAKRSG